MASKLFTLLALTAVLSQASAVSTIWLPDETTTHLTNPLIPKTIGIAKSWLDTLVSCNVIFPNGVVHEAYPNNNLPHDTIYYLHAVQPFTACSIGFRNAPPSLSGTYELMSHVRHGADLSETLTRKRFHLTFEEVDIWSRSNVKVVDTTDE